MIQKIALKCATALLTIALLFNGSSCKENEVVEELPKFAELLVQMGSTPIVGYKVDEGNALLSRPVQLTIKAVGTSTSRVEFTETFLDIGQVNTLTYTVTLNTSKAGRNATPFTVAAQTVGTSNIAGVLLTDNEPLQAHGYYEAFTTDRKPLNRLYYRLAINGKRYTYDFPRPCPSGQSFREGTCK